jgi:two-component system, OmpR family, response regulator
MSRICSVLVVENHEAVRRLLGEALESDGYQLTLAANGAAMRAALAQGRHDIAIIDVSVRGEDGFELAEEAARNGLSVILTTADRAKFDAVESSGRPHVLKPYQMPRLLDLVRHAMAATGSKCVRRRRPAA